MGIFHYAFPSMVNKLKTYIYIKHDITEILLKIALNTIT